MVRSRSAKVKEGSLESAQVLIELTNDIEVIKSKGFKIDEEEFYISPLIYENGRKVLYVFVKEYEKTRKSVNDDYYWYIDRIRRLGGNLQKALSYHKVESIYVRVADEASQLSKKKKEEITALIEGIISRSYEFVKYLSDAKKGYLSTIYVSKDIYEFLRDEEEIWIGVFFVRDLVNEPNSYLTAETLAKEIKDFLSSKENVNVKVLNRSEIEREGMGGLLAVNRGSPNPPTFTIIEYKPENYKNKRPVVLVGKGLVFDTGGLSLKPTLKSMDEMKCDMAGGASVAGIIYGISSLKIPIWVIGLIPATDNRPGENAYAPGDIVKMHNGKYVEVMNTDAEGRIILADALSYARKFSPEFVIDMATLTGAAKRAVGELAMVGMGTLNAKNKEILFKAANKTNERIVEFPLWEDYFEQIKSPIADIKNTGGDLAGAITAGKFLEFFTRESPDKLYYEWYHLDIAGVAYFREEKNYYQAGGTGIPVRCLINFFKEWSELV